MDKTACGQHFETVALQYLKKQRLRLIERNYRCRWGEIDLIMQDGDSLVFIEVRFRSSSSYASAAASVDYKKQQKLCKAAANYLAQKTRADTPARFDVLSLSQTSNTTAAETIEWIKNAFDCV